MKNTPATTEAQAQAQETEYSAADLLAAAGPIFGTTRDVLAAAIAGRQRMTISAAKAALEPFTKKGE